MTQSIHGRGTPFQAETEGMGDAEALALRITRSPARFVMVCEHHHMTLPVELLDDGPRSILIDGRFHHYCSEATTEEDILKVTNRVRKKILTQEDLQKSPPVRKWPNFSRHDIGSTNISIDEAAEKFREKFGKSTLVDMLIFKSFRKHMKIKLDEKIPDSLMFALLRQVMHARGEADTKRSLSGKGKAPGVLSIAADYVDFPANQNAIRNLYSQGATHEAITTVLENQIGYFYLEHAKARAEGKADAHAAGKVLDCVGTEDRAVIVFGMGHGILNSASVLPKQIASQGQSLGHQDVSIERIVLVEELMVNGIRELIQYTADEKQLNPDVTVYDYKLRQEWPIIDWYNQGHKIYGLPISKIIQSPEFG